MGHCGAWLDEDVEQSLAGIDVHRFELVTLRRRRVTTKIGRLAGLSVTAFVRILRRVVGVTDGRIAVDSGNNGNEGGSRNAAVTAGFALYYLLGRVSPVLICLGGG
jgi:hypothetical protein